MSVSLADLQPPVFIKDTVQLKILLSHEDMAFIKRTSG